MYLIHTVCSASLSQPYVSSLLYLVFAIHTVCSASLSQSYVSSLLYLVFAIHTVCSASLSQPYVFRSICTSCMLLSRYVRRIHGIVQASLPDTMSAPHCESLYLSSAAYTPGSSLPSKNSREAPPPVEMWLILSAKPN